MNKIFIDCEWDQKGKIYLIGYCNSNKKIKFLYKNNLTKKNFKKILKNINYIFFFGPDIAYIEKNFNINLRTKYKCVNIYKLYKHYLKLPNYKLTTIEKYFKINRTTIKYKNNIRFLIKDWHNNKINDCLQYNYEDVYNLVLIKEKLFTKFNIKTQKLKNFILE